eukprot:TRINITY_DN3104_c0_g1_i1.p2 TRINITY_DN3104_c0_g1~~TRINITY_DN3104_c0_g1_i1.p2  ORF type:complete len:670 (-),score=164.84 TRINITY_DN3104_c0_g1_i1:87-2096(-)
MDVETGAALLGNADKTINDTDSTGSQAQFVDSNGNVLHLMHPMNEEDGQGRSPTAATLKRQWEFAGYGRVLHYKDAVEAEVERHRPPLGQLRATAIAGNDITSSILYTAGIATAYSGVYAPVAIILVCCTLYCFRSIYAELGSALPFNGGSYNALLNTTNKLTAASVACLSVLSYLATALVSGSSAVDYLLTLDGLEHLPEFWLVIGLLSFFCLLTLVGVSESASVATGLFIFHMSTLSLLAGTSVIHICLHGFGTLTDNLSRTDTVASPYGEPLANIYFGFAASLLGVTGFETSCNYIEEQQPGVFPKTLRNMWCLVSFFNPVISFLALCVLTVDEITENQEAVLSRMALISGGDTFGVWVKRIVILDAFLVLAGAVLTSFVGVTGLLERLCLDRCMPQFLLSRNKARGTLHVIIVGFYLLCTSLWAMSQDLKNLAGVYGIAFLSVMTLVAIGNMLLKYKRGGLPRSPIAPWPMVIVGFVLILAGLVGTIVMRPEVLKYFTLYFGIVVFIIITLFSRIKLLHILNYFLGQSPFIRKHFQKWVKRKVREINANPIVFFTKTNAVHVLNKAVLYCMANEDTSVLYIVHVYTSQTPEFLDELKQNVKFIDQAYPKIAISLILVEGVNFSPGVVRHLSTALNTPTNFMFLGCPDDRFIHNLDAFGGVRLITH